jgi:hypothetical protein
MNGRRGWTEPEDRIENARKGILDDSMDAFTVDGDEIGDDADREAAEPKAGRHAS